MANRRKFLIGMGSLAAGSAAALGTSATTTFNLNERGVSANVTTDSNGAVALSNEEPGKIVNNTGNELEIDFAQGDGAGVSVGSRVNVGSYDGAPQTDPAFSITNQTTTELDLEIEFVAGESYKIAGTDNGSEMEFKFRNPDGADETFTLDVFNEVGVTDPGDTNSIDAFSTDGAKDPLGSGETLSAALQVRADQPDSSASENLSGHLNITATQD